MIDPKVATQIVAEEWQAAVREFGLKPGSPTEAVTARIMSRIASAPEATRAVHIRRRRESVTALEALEWMKARGLDASVRDIEWALKEITA